MLVDHGGLSAAAGDIAQGASKIENKLNDMDQALSPLKSEWDGSAKEAYTQAKQKWTQAITDMKLVLAEIGQAVETSNEDYRDGDKKSAGLFQ
ncbi:WXG100 family type VII secretion target [Phycicoccus sp. Soil748]|uniref:WXG100 family type VII secretion target n=1 Tax=Intrasporangiaceae TaxID=85021 RepID=UPI000A670FC1|nr:WXG100 family type VII secretion target [Phycicoccus sp. Soil748]